MEIGIYIHIPFCERKCSYCSFLSFDHKDKEERRHYVDCLLKEMEIWSRIFSEKIRCDSLFIGGGTPSFLEEGEVNRILKKASLCFQMKQEGEISIETNPGSLTAIKLREYRNAGVNRLSIGVQSFQDETLGRLGRIHDRKMAMTAYEQGRLKGYDNINLDLMFGVPGQSLSSWKEDIHDVIRLSPDHISMYSLQLEQGTPFYEAYRKGTMDLPKEEEDRKMFHYGVHSLKEKGYEHYEISNLGRKKCRHNLKYWSLDSYLGIGLGASSYLSRDIWEKAGMQPLAGDVLGVRWKNTHRMESWVESLSGEELPMDKKEITYEKQKETAAIYSFTALRRKIGISFQDFYKRIGCEFKEIYREILPTLNEYKSRGYLTVHSDGLALTESGIDISNEIMTEFL